MGITVLIADDNAMMRGFLEKLVTKAPHVDSVFVVKNGKEAVDKAQTLSPDMILLDVEMPEMDGLTALKQIKSLQKTGKVNPKAKVIILSGTMHENDTNVRKAKFLGASYVFPKPGGGDRSFSIDGSALMKALQDVG